MNKLCPYCENPSFRHGYYVTRANEGQRIARFMCRTCHRTFSTQTGTNSYRLRRPDLGPKIAELHAQHTSARKIARLLGVNRKTVGRRLRRLAASA